jgi:Bacterial sugar transferase
LGTSRALVELSRSGYRPTRIFEINRSETDALGVPSSLRATLDEVIELSRRAPIEQLFLLIKWDHARLVEDVLSILRVLPLPIHLLPDENVARFLATPMLQVGTAWTAELNRAPLSVAEQALKRAFDVLAASLGIILLSPLLLTSVLLIKLDSKGPVLFTQTRNGFNGRSFRIFKFRTMRVLEDGPKIRQDHPQRSARHRRGSLAAANEHRRAAAALQCARRQHVAGWAAAACGRPQHRI